MIAVRVPDLETDEIFGPVLVRTQFTAFGGNNVVATGFFGGDSGIDAGKLEVMTAISAANRRHFIFSAVDGYRLAWLEMNEVILVHIETDVSVEAVGSTQAPDDETGLSR